MKKAGVNSGKSKYLRSSTSSSAASSDMTLSFVRRRIQHLLDDSALVGSSARKSFQVDNFDLEKDKQLYRQK